MWIATRKYFFSICVTDETPLDYCMVRSRQPNAIRETFGRTAIVTKDGDYHYRCLIPLRDVQQVMSQELRKISYDNFKDACKADPVYCSALHKCWTALATIQPEAPYSGLRKYAATLPPDSPAHDRRRSKPRPKKGSQAWQQLAANHVPTFAFDGCPSTLEVPRQPLRQLLSKTGG